MAGSGVRLFLSGEIAYADDVNNYLMDQVIARFPTTAARDAAFGDGIPISNEGSGKPQLTEGRFCYIDNLNEVQFYDGLTWQSASQFSINDGAITTEKINNGAVTNAKVASNAAISLSKLESGTSGQLIVANSSGVPTFVSLTGDVSISSTGVASVQSIALGTSTTGNYVASLVAGTGITITNNTGEGATPTIQVTSNTYQPIDTELTAISGLTSAADTVPYFTGSGTAALGSFTSVGRNIVGAATVNAARTQLSLGTEHEPTFSGITADAVRVGITAANEIDTVSGNLILDSFGGTVSVDDNLTVSGDMTSSGKLTSSGTSYLSEVIESVALVGSASGAKNIDILTSGIHFFNTSSSASFSLNFIGDGSTSFNSITSNGQSVTAVVLATSGSTTCRPTSVSIDSTSVTDVKWFGGISFPQGSGGGAIDAYTFTIIKTQTAPTPLYTVLASQSKFA